jgi:hypothetical protein
LNGRLPAKLSKQTVRESVQRRDAEFKQKCKTYADNRRRTKASNIRIGDKVVVEQDIAKVKSLSIRLGRKRKKHRRWQGKRACSKTRTTATTEHHRNN